MKREMRADEEIDRPSFVFLYPVTPFRAVKIRCHLVNLRDIPITALVYVYNCAILTHFSYLQPMAIDQYLRDHLELFTFFF